MGEHFAWAGPLLSLLKSLAKWLRTLQKPKADKRRIRDRRDNAYAFDLGPLKIRVRRKSELRPELAPLRPRRRRPIGDFSE